MGGRPRTFNTTMGGRSMLQRFNRDWSTWDIKIDLLETNYAHQGMHVEICDKHFPVGIFI
ncbi:hypothetical protein QJS10_CPA03g02061 [Acorus calamus]|uniref:Uncharacterized protein n=1 Tax=Acorus calamus TaxID=4465 RepID=A0AAV9FBB3_ACOCL|nr:hypothetical protein QJS10_CPA03g02061 [Acorus calamus]